MPYSRLTAKDIKSILYRHASHTDQGILEVIAPPLLKDLAAEDPSIKAWPQEFIAYITVYLEYKCNRNSSPDDILLAGLLLRFIDSNDGMRLQPFGSAELISRTTGLKTRIRAGKTEIERKSQQGFIVDDEMLQQQQALVDEYTPLENELARKFSSASFEESKLKLAKIIGESRLSYLELFTANYAYPYKKPTLEILQNNVLFLLIQYMYYSKCVSKSEEKKPFKIRLVTVTRGEPKPAAVEFITSVKVPMETPEVKNVRVVEDVEIFKVVKDEKKGIIHEIQAVKGDIVTDEVKIVKDCRDTALLRAMKSGSIRHHSALASCVDSFTKELNNTVSRLSNPSPDVVTQTKIRFILAFHKLNILTPHATKNLLPVLVNYANKVFEMYPDAEPADPLLDELIAFFVDTFIKLKAVKPTEMDDEDDKESGNFKAFQAYKKSELIINYIAENANPRAKQRICEFLDGKIAANNNIYAEAVQELLRENNLLSKLGRKSARLTMFS